MSDDDSNIPKVFDFEGHHVTWIEWRGVQVWIAIEIGRAMGYGKDGKVLVNNITQRWSKPTKNSKTPRFRLGDASKVGQEPMDGFKLTGEDLDALRRALKGTQFASPSIDSRVNSILLLTESGLYACIQRGLTEAAIRFGHWINDEVIPAIRKDGVYQVEDKGNVVNLKALKGGGARRMPTDRELRAAKEMRQHQMMRQRFISQTIRIARDMDGHERETLLRMAMMTAGEIFTADQLRRLEGYVSRFYLGVHAPPHAQQKMDFKLPRDIMERAQSFPANIQSGFASIFRDLEGFFRGLDTVTAESEEGSA
ncbi:MAG: BRO family protein [Myxococcota bacterium]